MFPDAAGHIRTRGVNASPELDINAVAGSDTATFGGTLRAEQAELTVRVRKGNGQVLRLYRNGQLALAVPVIGDDFEHRTIVYREPATEGPLGTFWRVETVDSKVRTTIGNPIFLQAR
jgi:hypothetical protein